MIIKKFLKIVVALLAVIIGLIALLIPVMPTSPFMLFALALFSPETSKKILSKVKSISKRFRKK